MDTGKTRSDRDAQRHGDTENDRDAQAPGDTDNVVRFPRDWFGPVEDLVPFGPRAPDPHSDLDPDAFWGVLDNHRWAYPYDAKGERRRFKDIPKTVVDLKDDPFRSLAGELRRSGGFAKDTTPFSEFLWADFLRRKMSRKSVEENFEQSIEKALALAKSKDAVYLPGWCGAASDN